MKAIKWNALYKIVLELNRRVDDFSVYENLAKNVLPTVLLLNKTHLTLFDENGSASKEYLHGFTKANMKLLGERGIVEETKRDLLKEGTVVIVNDTQKDKRADRDIARKLDVGSYANIIFRAYEDETPSGYLHLCKSMKAIKKGEVHRFTREDIPFLGSVGGLVAISLRNFGLYEKLNYEALTHGLTKLPNMRSFYRTLDQKLREVQETKENFSVVMSDIDNFKRAVKKYQHLAGSEIIKELARLLRENIKDEDYVSNYAGDEFIFLLPKTKKEAAAVLTDRLREVISQHTFYPKHPRTRKKEEYRMTCCFGIAESTPSISREEIIRRADYALNKAKEEKGKNASLVYRK